MDWIIGSKPLPFDDIHNFQLWMDDGSLRKAKRAGNQGPWTPGVLMFTDCRHPLSNAMCDERNIRAWRITSPPGES